MERDHETHGRPAAEDMVGLRAWYLEAAAKLAERWTEPVAIRQEEGEDMGAALVTAYQRGREDAAKAIRAAIVGPR